ncbi:hypothetical protein SEA_APHELION_124 [Gordonia phage Aphelion]|uniref:Uncharacterized protein n=1 Tax=Gordonia phage Aphelion TaxID=2507860 RepID=A0A410TD95_9CAUD|nr:hypothetical protein SEA_APHELION_124 [Gordonia phage Aphelion]
MFAKFEVRKESETVEVTGLPAVGKFRDGYFATENLTYRRITVALWFDSDQEQVRLVEVKTIEAGVKPEIALDLLKVIPVPHRPSSDGEISTYGRKVYYLESHGRHGPANWSKVPEGLLDPMILNLKV